MNQRRRWQKTILGDMINEKCPYLHLRFSKINKMTNKNLTLILLGLLHPWPLASRPDVIPKVHDSTRDVISSHSKEGHLGGSRLQCDSEHDGDDK